MIAEIPFGIVAIHIEFAERRSAVTYGYQNQFLVSSRHFFGHDPVGAVCQLVDSPQLLGGSRELRHCHDFRICRGGQCAIGSFNHDLVIRAAQISASIGHGSNGPLLMRTETYNHRFLR